MYVLYIDRITDRPLTNLQVTTANLSNEIRKVLVSFGTGNLSSVWHPARLIKAGGRVDMSMDTLHLKHTLVQFRSEGPALTLPLCLLSPVIIMVCHCSSTMTEDHFLEILYGIKWPLCADVLLNPYSLTR